MTTPLLELANVDLSVTTDSGVRRILRSASLQIAEGESLGLVGESGSGKSTIARAVTSTLARTARIDAGQIRFGGADLAHMSRKDRAAFRSGGVSLIPQDPMASINPVHTVGDFLTEPLRVLGKVAAQEANARAASALAEVGIRDPERVLKQHPHQLSGGMLQRVMICAATLSGARLIVADEPTTALDVTSQSEVMAILTDLRRERGLSLLFISHDIDLALAVCDRVAVMYAGEVVEVQSARDIAERPRHPYTQGLFAARPQIEQAVYPLPAIPGRAVAAYEVEAGCAFAPRCSFALDRCQEHPPLTEDRGRLVRCWRADEIGAEVPGHD